MEMMKVEDIKLQNEKMYEEFLSRSEAATEALKELRDGWTEMKDEEHFKNYIEEFQDGATYEEYTSVIEDQIAWADSLIFHLVIVDDAKYYHDYDNENRIMALYYTLNWMLEEITDVENNLEKYITEIIE